MHIDDPTFDGKNIQEQTHVEESTEKICKVQNIRRLDEPEQRKFGDFHFYCLHCEVHLRNVRHVKDHIRTGEHLANQNRGHDRACLKQYLGNLKKHYHCPTTAHIFALDLFALSICNEHTNDSFLEKQHEQNVRQILNAMEKTLEQAFSKYLVQGEQHLAAVKLCVTGSNLTGMHSVKMGVCTLDIFAKFNEQLKKNNKMSFLYLRTCEVLRDFTRHLHRGTTILDNGKYCPVNIRQIPPSHYCSAALQFNLLFGPFCYSIKLGFGDLAEQAYLSTRLVLAYCNIWPQAENKMENI